MIIIICLFTFKKYFSFGQEKLCIFYRVYNIPIPKYINGYLPVELKIMADYKMMKKKPRK